MQDSSSDDELFVGLGDLSAAVDDDSAADVAEPSSTELDAFRAVELACLEGRRIATEAGAALSIASGWYAKISEGAYGAVIRDALLKAVVERPPLKVSAIADRCQALYTRRGGQARARAELTAAGAACLRLYQQSNYSGPLPSNETLKLVEGYAPKLLDVGGDAPSPFVAAPGALTLALALLEAAETGAASWWLVRAKTLHARCLVTGSHRVCGTFFEAISKHAEDARKWLEGASSDTRALLELEIGLAEHFLDEPGRGLVPESLHASTLSLRCRSNNETTAAMACGWDDPHGRRGGGVRAREKERRRRRGDGESAGRGKNDSNNTQAAPGSARLQI